LSNLCLGVMYVLFRSKICYNLQRKKKDGLGKERFLHLGTDTDG